MISINDLITDGIPDRIISLINLLLGILFMSMISLETYYGDKIVNELFTLKKIMTCFYVR